MKKILVVIGIILSLIVGIYFYNANNTGISVDVSSDLMPMRGPAVGYIQEKKYYYNQVYLYRLLDMCYEYDYKNIGLGTPGLNVEDSQTIEDIVLLELYYREAISEVTVSDEEIINEQIRRVAFYESLEKNNILKDKAINLTQTEIADHKRYYKLYKEIRKKSLFHEGQTESGFSEDLVPYIRKYLYIVKYIDIQRQKNLDGDVIANTLNFRAALLDKYNVKIIE